MSAIGVLSLFCMVGIASGYMATNTTHVCCDGTVGVLGMACCGDKTYNATNQLCCGNELMPIKEGQDPSKLGCCAGTNGWVSYDKSTLVCCRGVISKALPHINASKFYECCDDPKTNTSEPYIPAISLCCNGAVIGKPDSYRNYVCCGDELLADFDYIMNYVYAGMMDESRISPNPYSSEADKLCCGDQKVYYPNDKICASIYDPKNQKREFKLFDRPNNHSAPCGLTLYDTETQDCCNQKTFNKTTHYCCKEVIVEVTSPIKFTACCYQNGELFDIRKQYCNSEGVKNLDKKFADQYQKLINMCDDSFPIVLPSYTNVVSTYGYETRNGTHVCCNGKIGDISMECCGAGDLYDSKQNDCCNSKLYTPKELDKDVSTSGCCSSDDGKISNIFNYNTEVCCNGQVLKKEISFKDSYQQCCTNPTTNVSSLFAYDTARCCNGVVMELPDKEKYFDCCANELLQVSYEAVDFGQMNVADRCCGEQKKYKPASQICASKYDKTIIYEVLDIQNNHTKACGLKAYDTQTHGCCDYIPYLLKSQICCNSKITETEIESIYSSCCWQDSKIYDIRKQVCDGPGVRDLDSQTAAQNIKNTDSCGPTFPPNIKNV